MKKIKMGMLLIVAGLIPTPTLAVDYVVNINGMVCEFCAFGVTKKISKLPFIDRSKYTKGVKVEIKKQMVTISVKDDFDIDKSALFSAIESGGYNPVELWEITPSGERVLL